MYYQSSENKDADQFPSYCEADLRLCFCIGKNQFSHDVAHFISKKVPGNSYSHAGT